MSLKVANKQLGALGRNRTCDQEIRRLLLYPLSYEGERARIVGNFILHKAKHADFRGLVRS